MNSNSSSNRNNSNNDNNDDNDDDNDDDNNNNNLRKINIFNNIAHIYWLQTTKCTILETIPAVRQAYK
jgi:hypothetical protein